MNGEWSLICTGHNLLKLFRFGVNLHRKARVDGSRARLIHVRPSVALLAARMAGWLVRDVVLTRDEIDGLMAGHLVSADPPTASTRFTEWLEAEGATLGRRYASELGRHYRRPRLALKANKSREETMDSS